MPCSSSRGYNSVLEAGGLPQGSTTQKAEKPWQFKRQATYHTAKEKVLWLLFRWSGDKWETNSLVFWQDACRSDYGTQIYALLFSPQHQGRAKGLPLSGIRGPQLCLEGISNTRVRCWRWGWAWCLQDDYPLGLIKSSLKGFPWRLQVIFSFALAGKFRSSPRLHEGLQHRRLIICFTGQDEGIASKTSDLKSHLVENRQYKE